MPQGRDGAVRMLPQEWCFHKDDVVAREWCHREVTTRFVSYLKDKSATRRLVQGFDSAAKMLSQGGCHKGGVLPQG